MKVNLSDIKKIWTTTKDKPEELREILYYLFSFKENIGVFSQFCLSDTIKGNVPDFHKEWYNILEQPSNNAWAGPRGHAKSSTVGIVYILWRILYNKNKYIVYISQNHEKTVQFITPLRIEAKENLILKFIYGNIQAKIKENKDSSIEKDTESIIDINGCRVQAVSFEKNMRGFKFKNMRPDLIIGDDIESDERTSNPVLRKKDLDKLTKVIIPSLDINGRFKMIGTILHLDSLLMNRIKAYDGKIYKAEDENGNLLWKERFTKEKLEEIKKDIGTVAYNQEYLNNPIDNTTSLIKYEWISECFTTEKINKSDMDYIYLGVDFAFSDRITSDYSAFVEVGIKGKNKYLLNIYWKKGMSLPEQFEFIRNLHKNNNYDTIALEENSIKSYSKEINELNLPIKMFWTGSRDTDNKVKTTKGKSYSKVNAVNRLAVEFENKIWKICYDTEEHKKVANRLSEELISWSLEDGKLVELGVHPDGPIGMILVNEALGRNILIDNVKKQREITNIETELDKSINSITGEIKKLPSIQ